MRSLCYVRMPDSAATHNEVCLPWMPDRHVFAIHVKGFLDSLLFAKALMINQWELANARSYGSSPVHASTMRISL